MEILTGNQRVLRQKSKRISKVDDSIRTICSSMVEVMLSSGGIGLAGNQVGILKRIIIILHEDVPIVMINPEIVKISEEFEYGNEGCLSIPETYIDLKRHKEVVVKYRDTKGKPHFETYSGLSARIVQHEIEHLDGILMTDHIE
jgi:peptide deformylase